jgi:hypothetical protein
MLTDRDEFAAAALTGLLSGRVKMYADVMEDRSDLCGKALRIADAMLAARGTTEHDAAPAAVPADPAAGEAHEARVPSGTGDTRAWRRSEIYHRFVVGASSYARWDPGPVADHYFDRLCDLVDDIVGSYAAPPAAGPTLTDAEREIIKLHALRAGAICRSGCVSHSVADEACREEATLRGLLARAAKEGR